MMLLLDTHAVDDADDVDLTGCFNVYKIIQLFTAGIGSISIW